jgi:hypothetical protein
MPLKHFGAARFRDTHTNIIPDLLSNDRVLHNTLHLTTPSVMTVNIAQIGAIYWWRALIPTVRYRG